jgi:hypothetical protein
VFLHFVYITWDLGHLEALPPSTWPCAS